MKKITSLLMILFTILGFSQDNKGKIQAYLDQNKAKYNLTSEDIGDWFIESTGNSESTKIDTYWIKQRYQGIEIFNALSNVWVKNGEVINIQNGFISNISSKINVTTPTLSVLDALGKGFLVLNEIDTKGEIIETISPKEFKISNGSNDPITAELVYQTVGKTLKLSWDFAIPAQNGNHIWSIKIDAINGKLLTKNDLVISCSFPNNHKTSTSIDKSLDFSKTFLKNEAVAPLQVQGGTYRVVPFNYVSPLEIGNTTQLISNPENASASPKGWHNANTLTGTTASLIYNYTRGNNVWARTCYTCTSASETVSTVSTTTTANGYSPSNAGLSFDYAYPGTSVAANTYINACVTNLFYMNNICHDIWYKYGFNEANGNYQKDNHSLGGIGADAVLANAQYGSTAATPSLNNSNFSPNVDGSPGTMRMYLWTESKTFHNLLVNSPTVIAGDYDYKQNGFSPGHVDLPVAPAALQSNLVLYEDGTSDPGYTDGADACGAATNAAAINGHIVLVRRSLAAADGGSPCNFTVKVKNAQLAGAIGVIVYNNIEVTDTNGTIYQYPIGMSGADATITIPAIGVTKTVGEMLHDQLTSGSTVNVKLQLPSDYVPWINADGDLDNGVIAHEFGHGISTRLAGGPSNSSCLQNPEQMGEGWSDWFALMLQLKPGDVGTTPIGIGNYVTHQAANGPGIRNYPYSTDMSVNPETFGYTNGGTAPMFSVTTTDTSGTEYVEVHQTGEIWTTMLWDLTWAYINKYGYDDDKYTGTGGNNKVMRLVLDAIKLQPCGPSYVQARNALIAADQATTGGQDYCMIWQVFARRGLGVNASSGDNSGDVTNVSAIHDQIEDFTEPTVGTTPATGSNCTLSVNYFENQDLFRIYPNPTNGFLNIRINNYVGKVNIQVIDINGRIVSEYKNEEFNIEKSLNLNNLQTGMYVLKVSGDSLNFTQKIMKN